MVHGTWHTITWSETSSGSAVGNDSPIGSVPAAGDTIVIPAGLTVSISGSPNTIAIDNSVVLNIYGLMSLPNSSSKLTLEGDNSVIQVDAGGDITTAGSGQAEAIVIGKAPGTVASISGDAIDAMPSPNSVDQDNIDTGGCAGVGGGCDVDPLPIELIFFNAGAEKEGIVELTWATATEENFEYFEISHSLDGKDFEVIGTVAGNGNTTRRHDYSFKDPAPYSGLNYYQLKSIDFDGYTEIFPLVAVQLNQQLRPQVYPNPSNGYQLKFKGLDALNPFDVEIISLDGRRQLLNKAVKGNTLTLNPALSPGLYIVNTTVGKQSFSQRLIIR